MPNVMVALPNIGGALCSTPQSLADTQYWTASVFATEACIDNRKNLLNSNISSTCHHSMVNFGPLTAEIGLPWGTHANFNGFRVLAALLHSTLIMGVSQTLWR